MLFEPPNPELLFNVFEELPKAGGVSPDGAPNIVLLAGAELVAKAGVAGVALPNVDAPKPCDAG